MMVKIDKYSRGAGRGQARGFFYNMFPELLLMQAKQILKGEKPKLSEEDAKLLDAMTEVCIKDGYNFDVRMKRGDFKHKNLEGE